MASLHISPLANYTFGVKGKQPEEDPSVTLRMERLERDFSTKGMRQSMDAVMVVHDHGHPHVLMFQLAAQFYRLPGAYLHPGEEDEVQALKRALTLQLSPDEVSEGGGIDPDWEVMDVISTWWRPNFETFMYPYLPPHVSRPKERRNLYLVKIPPRKSLCVPQNMRLVAVPLFELYENTSRYGAQLSALPHALSSRTFILADDIAPSDADAPLTDDHTESHVPFA